MSKITKINPSKVKIFITRQKAINVSPKNTILSGVTAAEAAAGIALMASTKKRIQLENWTIR